MTVVEKRIKKMECSFVVGEKRFRSKEGRVIGR